MPAVCASQADQPTRHLHSAQNRYHPTPVLPHQWNMAVCAFEAVHPLSETETLFLVLYKNNCFHCNIVYWVFSKMSEIPGSDSASRMYLEA